MRTLISLLGATLLFAVPACESDSKALEVKIDALNQKMDRLLKQGVGAAGQQQQRQPRPEPKREVTYAVPVDGDAFDGPADALVTIVKAYDYACPFCEKVRGTMDDLLAKYPGELRVVYKQLVVHPNNAMAGALAFCAAAKQGKHKDMDRLIWDEGFNKNRTLDNSDVAVPSPAEANNQIAAGGSAAPPPAAKPQKVKCWDTPEGCKHVVSYAQQLQLNLPQFKQDMKACQQLVQKDERELKALLVSATPAFFVNGRYISGAVPIDQFIPVIDEELKKAKERVAQGTPKASYYQTWIIEKGQKTAP